MDFYSTILSWGPTGATLFLLVWKILPKIFAAHREDLAKEREAHGHAIAQIVGEMKAEREAHASHIEKIVGRLERVEDRVQDIGAVLRVRP